MVNFCAKVWGTLKKDITIPFEISVSDNMTESETTANEIPKMIIIKDPFLKDLQKILLVKIISYFQSFIHLFFLEAFSNQC
jgi:hypothetical protein